METNTRRKTILGRMLLKLTRMLLPDLTELIARALDGQPILQVVRDDDDLEVWVNGIGGMDYDFLDLGHISDGDPGKLHEYITETRNMELPFSKDDCTKDGCWDEMVNRLNEESWDGVPYMIVDPPDGELGVKIPGLVRDMLMVNFGTLSYDTCAEFAAMLDDRLMQFDWFELGNGKQFECTFDPTIDTLAVMHPNTNVPIQYCVFQIGDANGGGLYHINVTRTRDGKTVTGKISGNNGQFSARALVGDVHYGYYYTETFVGTRRFNEISKSDTYLGSTGEDIATNILKLFAQN